MKKYFYCLVETNFGPEGIVFTYYGTKSNFNRKAKAFIATYYGTLYFKSRLYLEIYSSLEAYLSSDRLRRIPYRQ